MVPFLSMEKSQCVKNGENLRLFNFTMFLPTQLTVNHKLFQSIDLMATLSAFLTAKPLNRFG